jgi:putative flippase GtrA
VKLASPINPQEGRRFGLFALVGVLNTAVDFAVFSAAVFAGVNPAPANLIAFAVANPLSYVVNGRVTFRYADGPAALSLTGYGKFCAAHLVSLAISTGLVVWLSAYAGPFYAKLAAIGVALFINYAASAIWVYRTGEKTTPESPESL